MATFRFLPRVDDNTYVSAKINEDVTDSDVGKPVKLSAADTYALCADGDGIDGFLQSIEPQTQDGKVFGTVQVAGRRCVQLAGAAAVGVIVEAGAPATLNTAETDFKGKVSAHTVAAVGDILDKNWRVISGTGLDLDATAIIESL